jgi:hypothetical protein
MGVRLYNPNTGRFLSADPVAGGNENAYNYPNNPIDEFDLDGRWWHRRSIFRAIGGVGRFAYRHRDEIALGLGIVGSFACAVCGVAFYASMAISAYSTAKTCHHHRGAGCALGAASLAYGGSGRAFNNVGRRMIRRGNSFRRAGRGYRLVGRALRGSGRFTHRYGTILGWAGNGASAGGVGCNYWRRCGRW